MSGLPEDEIVEHTLAQIPECYLFHLPPRVRAQGWLAADMTKQMWTGRMRVVQRGLEAAVMLIDRRDGKLFAMCKVEDGAVERVPDSSRYFVIKITNAQGRHAFVGLAFDDRNQAFDFNVALQEFKKDVERSKMLAEGTLPGDGRVDGIGADSTPGPASNLSLKEGEKIKISLGGKSTTSRPRRSSGSGGKGAFTLAPPPGDTQRRTAGGGGRLLAPPPGDTRRARPVISKPASGAIAAGSTTSSVGIPSSHGSMTASQPAAIDGGRGLGLGAGAGGAPNEATFTTSDVTVPSSGARGASATPPSGHATTISHPDDPLGLGLVESDHVPGPGSTTGLVHTSPGTSFASSNMPPLQSGSGWGLSNMSTLNAGLPGAEPAAASGFGGASRTADGSFMGPGEMTAGAARGPGTQLDPGQRAAYPRDSVGSRPLEVHDAGPRWGQSPGLSSGEASQGSASAAKGSPAAALDDPFGGLF